MEILQDVEEMLEARSAQVVWEYYVARLTDLGFPNVLYYGTRILDSTSRRMIDDSVLLSSYDGSLLEELVDLGLFDSMPMYLWLVENPGCDSWDWIHRRRLEGLLSPREERALDLFARHGHVAGYGLGLGDGIKRRRGGVLLSGKPGMSQHELDQLWTQRGRLIQALTGLVHLRLSTLPYAEPQDVLTLRQREVLECISSGRTTQEIADLLEVAPATVEKHLRLTRKALGARTTAQAVLLAMRRRQIFSERREPCMTKGNEKAKASNDEPGQLHPWSLSSRLPPMRLTRAPSRGN
uniref:helix-turn-helix transcriptional regulator n=1 Tax=Paracoccus sp. TRP TaxID=412597 RepID=UPI000225F604|nr:LuxR family transcriptional regulator [Paracoccus sp. TRP]